MKSRILINIIILAVLLLFAFLMHRCTVSGSDVVRTRRNPGGDYFFFYSGSRIWTNPSFREGSMSGKYRGGGPRAGK